MKRFLLGMVSILMFSASLFAADELLLQTRLYEGRLGISTDISLNETGSQLYYCDIYGLHVYDLSNPAEPVRTDVLRYDKPARFVERGGGLIYLAMDSSVVIFNQTTLSIQSTVDFPAQITTLAASGRKCMVGWEVEGEVYPLYIQSPLACLDAENATSPVVSAFGDTVQTRILDAALFGDTLSFIYGTGQEDYAQYQEYCINNITDPEFLKGMANSEAWQNLERTEGRLAISTLGSGIHYYDTFPDSWNWYNHRPNPSAVWSQQVRVCGTKSYEFNAGTLYSVDISDLNSMSNIDSTNTWPDFHTPTMWYDVDPSGSILVMPFAEGGFSIYSLVAGTLTLQTSILPEGFAYDVHIDQSGDLLFIANGFGGLDIVNIADTETPVTLGTWADGTRILTAWGEGTLALAAGADSVLHVIDVTDPESPVQLSSLKLAGCPSDIDAEGTVAIIAMGTAVGIAEYDLSDPESPTLLDAENAEATSVFLDLPYLFAVGPQIAFVFSMADPSDMYYYGAHSLCGYDVSGMQSVAWTGEYLLLADPRDALTVFEFDTLRYGTATSVASMPLPTAGEFVAYDSGYCAVTAGWEGVFFYDMTEGEDLPVLVSTNDTWGDAQVVSVSMGKIAVAAGNEVLIYHPVEFTIDSAPEASSLPDRFTVGMPYPNPFNASVSVPFTLGKTGVLNVKVVDVLGRTVYSEAREWSAGSRRFDFTPGALNLASGHYWISFKAGGVTQTVRVVQVK